MKYQIGDKVLILHSDEEGTIVDFISDKMVMVEVRDVKFPVYIDQIDFPYFKRFTEKKHSYQNQARKKTYAEQLPKEKKAPITQKEDGVWLNFLPVFGTDEFGDEYVKHLKVHLVNSTSNHLKFTYTLRFFGNKEFELKNDVLPFQHFYIHDIDFDDMNDSPSFAVDFSLMKPDKTKADHFESHLKVKPKQLFEKIDHLQSNNEASFSYKLLDHYPEQPLVEENTIFLNKLADRGFKVYNAQDARKHLPPAQSVIDLHIEKLTDSASRMSNFEMLTLQLKTFEKYYELAVSHMLPSFIVIHGVGTGKLRDEIHDILRLKKEVSYFVNQYNPRYGYGATEIFFKY